jgi:dTDP-4-dehydrorhamnose reductase
MIVIMFDNLVVSGDSKIGAVIAKRLNAAATTRKGTPGLLHFDLRENLSLPFARTTYFCSGINGFKACADDPQAAFEVNVIGTRRAATGQVRAGCRVVLLSSCAAETHPATVYGSLKLTTEKLFKAFGEQAAIFRFGPVKFEGRATYANGDYQPIEIGDLVDVLTAPFRPGLHRILNAQRESVDA